MNHTIHKAIQLMKFYNMPYDHILEFGVYTGTTINQIKSSVEPNRYKIYGFDTFEGLPEDWKGTPCAAGHFSTGGNVPNIPDIHFFKGLFSNTIPIYKQNSSNIALLHCDADLYSSTIDILYGLNDYIVKNTIIIFDEWYYNHLNIPKNRLHERKAFFKWTIDKNREYFILPQIEEERRIVVISK